MKISLNAFLFPLSMVIIVPPKLFLSLFIRTFYFMPRFGFSAHFISCHVLDCSRILFHATFWGVWYVGKDCPGILSRLRWCTLFQATPSLFSPLQCILFHAPTSVRSWRLIAFMHFVSCGAWFILVHIDAFYFMQRYLSVCIDAFYFMRRYLSVCIDAFYFMRQYLLLRIIGRLGEHVWPRLSSPLSKFRGETLYLGVDRPWGGSHEER